jgi:hypothetical protein
MKSTAFLSIAFLLVAQVAAASTWSIIAFSAEPQNAPAVVAAADKLMSSEAGKTFTGRLFLQINVADGDNPATHSFVPVYRTAAEREAFVEKLQSDPAWTEFQEAMTKLTQPVSNVMYRTLKRWGEISDDDKVWRAHAFDVNDASAFLAALDAFMASETGKKFPGQVFLSAVVSGGLTPVSHVISVGQASEAAIEAWEQTLQGNADWAAYLEASGKAAEYLGNNMVRTVKTWGATLDDVTR